MKAIARTIYQQAKPISFIYQPEPIDTARNHDFSETLHAWAEAAPLFETSESIAEQIKRLQFGNSGQRQEIDVQAIKAGLLYEVLRTSVQFDNDSERQLVDELALFDQSSWLVAALLMRPVAG